MNTSDTDSDYSVLVFCAIPRWFNINQLNVLLTDVDREIATVEKILTHPSVLPVSGYSDRYILKENVRSRILVKLKEKQMSRYVDFHKQIFGYYLDLMQSTMVDDNHGYEDELIFHLNELYLAFMETSESTEFSRILSLTNNCSFAKQEHRDLILFFQGYLHNEKGNYGNAAKIFLELLKETNLQLELRARILIALGINYDYQGQFDHALEVYRQSIDIYNTLGDSISKGVIQINMGIIHYQLSEYEEALSLFKLCRNLFDNIGEPFAKGAVLNELGATSKALGQWQASLIYYQQSLDIWQEMQANTLMDSAWSVRNYEALLYNNLGEVHHLLSEWNKAEAYFEKALAIVLDKQEEKKREASDMLLNYGFLLRTEDKFTEAQNKYEHALLLAKESEDKIAISSTFYHLGNLYQQQRNLDQAFQAFHQSIDMFEKLRGEIVEPKTKISLMGIQQQVYQAMVLLCIEMNKPEEALHYVERAKSRAILDVLAQPTIVDTPTSENPLTIAEIQAQLPTGVAIIEFFMTGSRGLSEELLDKLPPDTRKWQEYLVLPGHIFAFIITHNSLHVIKLQGNARRIENQHFDKGSNRLIGTNPESIKPLVNLEDSSLDLRKHLQDLQERLFKPLYQYLSEIKHVYLIPHDILHYIPLHAVHTYNQRNDSPKITFSYAPSTSTLCKIGLSGSQRSPGIKFLGIGVNALNLKYCEAEVNHIAEQLSGKVITSENASIENVCAIIGDYNVIHFACHGYFQQRSPLASSLGLFNGELTAASIQQSVRLKADIVTLSACETGINHLAHGDEIIGLTRAFLIAGARSLLVSLWSIVEIPTVLFMERFYQAWKEGASRAEALNEAQRYLRSIDITTLHNVLEEQGFKKEEFINELKFFSEIVPGPYPFNHPYYWAAFILIGDPT